MRILLQIVNKAVLSIEQKEVANIKYGAVVFVGFKLGDNEGTIAKAVSKISKLRIFPDVNGKTNLNISDVNGEILSVSQFTLYAETTSNRPSFTQNMNAIDASKMYDCFNNLLCKEGIKTQKGVFGTDMKITQENTGPFSLILEF